MDPSKKIGKMKEQVGMENIARRRYPTKWGKLEDPQLNNFYNPNDLDQKLKEQIKQDLCSLTYTGEGDGFFLSKDMYNALVATCRCGRPRTEGHLLKCLRRDQNKYLTEPETMDTASEIEDVDVVSNESSSIKREKNRLLKVPPTSNALIGWQKGKPRYQQWEQSMKYFSPVLTMPGHRIAATPYNAIIIG